MSGPHCVVTVALAHIFQFPLQITQLATPESELGSIKLSSRCADSFLVTTNSLPDEKLHRSHSLFKAIKYGNTTFSFSRRGFGILCPCN